LCDVCVNVCSVDVQHNFIKSLEALRGLSLNTALTSLVLSGNPVLNAPNARLAVFTLLPVPSTLSSQALGLPLQLRSHLAVV
jgi:hypothetical protein